MCHPEIPEGQPIPEVHREETGAPLPGGESLPGLLCRPESRNGPPVLVICDVFGRSPFYESLGARLATAGFTAFVPELFFREGPLPELTREAAFARRSKLDDFRALRDLDSAVGWLQSEAGTDGAGRAGTIGFCMGGTMALQLAAERQDLAVACFYGFPAQQRAENAPPSPLQVADRISGPIIGFWGDQDTGVGMENVEALAQALTARGVAFEHTIYPDLGHGFVSASRLDPDHDAYDASCDAWTKTLDFYRKHLLSKTSG